MGYVLYRKSDTKLANSKVYATERAAKAQATRYNRSLSEQHKAEYELTVAEASRYYSDIEKMVTRTNLLTGKQYQESVNTPRVCSPASEAYWSA